MKNYASAVIKSLAVKAIVSNHKLFRKKKKKNLLLEQKFG